MTDLLHSDLLERATDDDRARLLLHLAEGLPRLVIPPSLRERVEEACAAAALASHPQGSLRLAQRAVQLGVHRVAERMAARTREERLADDSDSYNDTREAQTLHWLAQALDASSNG